MGRRRLVKPAQAPADKFINGVWVDYRVVQGGVWVGMSLGTHSTRFPVGGSSGETLVTLVSQMQPLWRGFTQGGVAPVFPFRASP